MQKKSNVREIRLARKNEIKEKYCNKQSISNINNDSLIKEKPIQTSLKNISEEEQLDIEMKNSSIEFFQIIFELKQSKEAKKAGKKPITYILGKYTDKEMCFRAFNAIKKACIEKHEVKDAGNNNDCFIIRGQGYYFMDSFSGKIYINIYQMETNSLARGIISNKLMDEV